MIFRMKEKASAANGKDINGELLVTYMSKLGYSLLGIGLTLLVLDLAGILPKQLAELSSLMWWILLIFASAALISARIRPDLLARRRTSFKRSEIVKPTEDLVANRRKFRRGLGAGLIFAAAALLLIDFVMLPDLLIFWFPLVCLPMIIVGLILWFRRETLTKFAHTCLMSIDIREMQQIHLRLRTSAEDCGFETKEEICPVVRKGSFSFGFKCVRKQYYSPLLPVIGIALALCATFMLIHAALMKVELSTTIGLCIYFASLGIFMYVYLFHRQKGEILVLEEGAPDGEKMNVNLTVCARCTPGFDEEILRKGFEEVVKIIR